MNVRDLQVTTDTTNDNILRVIQKQKHVSTQCSDIRNGHLIVDVRKSVTIKAELRYIREIREFIKIVSRHVEFVIKGSSQLIRIQHYRSQVRHRRKRIRKFSGEQITIQVQRHK